MKEHMRQASLSRVTELSKMASGADLPELIAGFAGVFESMIAKGISAKALTCAVMKGRFGTQAKKAHKGTFNKEVYTFIDRVLAPIEAAANQSRLSFEDAVRRAKVADKLILAQAPEPVHVEPEAPSAKSSGLVSQLKSWLGLF